MSDKTEKALEELVQEQHSKHLFQIFKELKNILIKLLM